MGVRETLQNELNKIKSLQEQDYKLLSNDNLYLSSPDIIRKDLYKIHQSNIAINSSLIKCESLLPVSEYSLIDVPASADISYLPDYRVYQISLHDLLPHRTYLDTTTNTIKYYYNKDMVYSGYRRAVEEYKKENDIYYFNEKITVLFRNIYSSNDNLIDNDNLEQKIFIDAMVNRIFIPDDNPLWIRQVMDSSFGDITHTEVIIGLPCDVENYERNL